jgi:hypothetical protein
MSAKGVSTITRSHPVNPQLRLDSGDVRLGCWQIAGNLSSRNLTSTDTTDRNAMLRVPPVASLVELASGPGPASS